MSARLSRTRGGKMIHRSDCTRISGLCSHAVPWDWADTVPLRAVADAVRTFGYRICLYCKPIPSSPPEVTRPERGCITRCETCGLAIQLRAAPYYWGHFGAEPLDHYGKPMRTTYDRRLIGPTAKFGYTYQTTDEDIRQRPREQVRP